MTSRTRCCSTGTTSSASAAPLAGILIIIICTRGERGNVLATVTSGAREPMVGAARALKLVIPSFTTSGTSSTSVGIALRGASPVGIVGGATAADAGAATACPSTRMLVVKGLCKAASARLLGVLIAWVVSILLSAHGKRHTRKQRRGSLLLQHTHTRGRVLVVAAAQRKGVQQRQQTRRCSLGSSVLSCAACVCHTQSGDEGLCLSFVQSVVEC